MKTIIIYTDGSCHGNPGPGGWGAILMYQNTSKEISGACAETTNNRMEITAAIEALKALKVPCTVNLHTDSAYLCRAFTQGWLERWQLNGWKTSNKKPVENMDLWLELLPLTQKHHIAWIKVKGHSDNVYNNRCDQLANEAVNRLELKQNE